MQNNLNHTYFLFSRVEGNLTGPCEKKKMNLSPIDNLYFWEGEISVFWFYLFYYPLSFLKDSWAYFLDTLSRLEIFIRRSCRVFSIQGRLGHKSNLGGFCKTGPIFHVFPFFTKIWECAQCGSQCLFLVFSVKSHCGYHVYSVCRW